ncbi:transposase, partial [bacterium]|nr:transposase [bacterium]
KKYGKRPDNRRLGRERLFKEISHKVSPYAEIISDDSPHYPVSVKKWFPQAVHKKTLGKRGCVTAQGELKKTGYDPIFSINHTFAMFRANVNRLIRKTWCTTKKIPRLEDHLAIYVEYHNNQLTKKII